MTEETGPPTEPDAPSEHEYDFDVHFVALVNLVAQLSAQLLQEDRLDEARGLIDGLAALEAKTKGNLVEPEEKLLETILFQLRMAALTASEKAAAEESVEKEAAPHNGDSPEGGNGADAPPKDESS